MNRLEIIRFLLPFLLQRFQLLNKLQSMSVCLCVCLCMLFNKVLCCFVFHKIRLKSNWKCNFTQIRKKFWILRTISHSVAQRLTCINFQILDAHICIFVSTKVYVLVQLWDKKWLTFFFPFRSIYLCVLLQINPILLVK